MFIETTVARRLLWYVAHPNIFSSIILTLGCRKLGLQRTTNSWVYMEQMYFQWPLYRGQVKVLQLSHAYKYNHKQLTSRQQCNSSDDTFISKLHSLAFASFLKIIAGHIFWIEKKSPELKSGKLGFVSKLIIWWDLRKGSTVFIHTAHPVLASRWQFCEPCFSFVWWPWTVQKQIGI